jgi:hypothetical protein
MTCKARQASGRVRLSRTGRVRELRGGDSQWLARDPARLAASLEEFVGHPAYNVAQLRQDLERLVFLLGGSDGEPLFGP